MKKKTLFILIISMMVYVVGCGGTNTASSNSENDYSKTEEQAESNEEQDSVPEMKAVWPKNELAKLIPEPASRDRKIEKESSDSFDIIINGVSEEEYESYIDLCWEKGFQQNYSKESGFFEAYNADGVYLEIKFTDQVMRIHMNAADETTKEEPDEENEKGIGAITFDIDNKEVVNEYDEETNVSYSIGGLSFQIPSTWEKRDKEGQFSPAGREESNYYVAFNEFEDAPKNWDEMDDVLKEYLSAFEKYDVEKGEIAHAKHPGTGSVEGYVYFNYYLEEKLVDGCGCLIVNEKDDRFVIVTILEVNESKKTYIYDYSIVVENATYLNTDQ